jgi:hypothetical protein
MKPSIEHSLLGLGLTVTLSCTLPCQLSGNYTVDPNSSGARNFKTLNAASSALDKSGVNGPVTITVAAGTYANTWYIPPVAGSSSVNRVVLKAAGSVTIGSTLNTFAAEFLFATPTTAIRWIVLEGIDFVGLVHGALDPSHATGLDHIEVRGCSFAPGKNRGGVSLEGFDHDIHHCEFTAGSGQCELYLFDADRCSVHHNVLKGGRIFLNGFKTAGAFRVYNNLVYDTSDEALILNNGFNSIIAHNTLLSRVVGSPSRAVLVARGHPLRPVSIHGNIVINQDATRSASPVILALDNAIISDGNLLARSSLGILVQLTTKNYTHLFAWQQGSGQDRNSISVDPKFKNAASDFRLDLLTSPAIDKAFGTPSFVTDDLDDNKRDAKPDMGCYEVPAFETFGIACPGTGSLTPEIGSTGSAAMGSTDFVLTLRKALGGSTAFLVLGESKTTWNGVPLPINFGGSCRLLVAGHIIQPLPTSGSGAGNGSVNLKVNLPSGTAWKGRVFYLQWAVADSFAPKGLAFSKAGRLILL